MSGYARIAGHADQASVPAPRKESGVHCSLKFYQERSRHEQNVLGISDTTQPAYLGFRYSLLADPSIHACRPISGALWPTLKAIGYAAICSIERR